MRRVATAIVLMVLVGFTWFLGALGEAGLGRRVWGGGGWAGPRTQGGG